MSLTLDADPKTTPGVEVKTNGFPENLSGRVEIWCSPNGQINIGYRDFLEMVCYVLTNTDLQKDDPRLALIERVGRLRVVTGFNDYLSKRLSEEGALTISTRNGLRDRYTRVGV